MDEDINRRRDCEQGLQQLGAICCAVSANAISGTRTGGFEDIQPIIAAEGVGVAPPP